MTSFKPTIFYIKQHTVTGLKYFGKTTNITVTEGSYRGGGKYWKLHIKKHGVEHVKTIWKSDVFTDRNECIEFGLKFSSDNNIVNSNEWANLEPENGINGFVPGALSALRGRTLTEEHKQKLRDARSKQPSPTKGKILSSRGTTRSDITKKKMSAAKIGKPSPKKGMANPGASIANKGIPKKKVECPNCGKIGAVTVWYKHHFDNCKHNQEKVTMNN